MLVSTMILDNNGLTAYKTLDYENQGVLTDKIPFTFGLFAHGWTFGPWLLEAWCCLKLLLHQKFQV